MVILKKKLIPWVVILAVLLADQVLKILVKTNMTLGQSIPVLGDWFILHFTENYGMAFGMEFSGEYGKLMLSLFRIVAVVFIGVYLHRQVNRDASAALLVCVSLILAGALGNIIDSAFYGLIFSESYFNQLAVMFPEDGGYGTLLHGKVVDMLYFPIIRGNFPEWFPWWAGQEFIFFRPVFNIADASITTGVFVLLIFQRKLFSESLASGAAKTTGEDTADVTAETTGEDTADVTAETTTETTTEVTEETAAETTADPGFLFEQIIFGPIRSRRLGISLGVNLLPLSKKHCTFNCLYCECGWTGPATEGCLTHPTREDIREHLKQKLEAMAAKKAMLTTITFAGNGEPTLHPDFPGIVDDTIALRDVLYPAAKISVLSNASKAGDPGIAAALKKVELNILKLDAGTEETFQQINNPRMPISLSEILKNLEQFSGQMVIQTLFVRGTIQGKPFDNTTDAEVEKWLGHIERLRPASVMIYPIARATPTDDVQKVEPEKLAEIAGRVEALGIPAEVYH